VPRDRPPSAIEDENRRDGGDIVATSDLPSLLTQEIQAHHGGPSFEVSFDPIHDGPCCEAGHSRVAEELDDNRLALGKQSVERGVRPEFGRRRPQGEPGARDDDDGDDERDVLAQELDPGGLGTLEEIFETLTWAQLGIHAKPCAFLNVEGYYDPLLQFIDRAVAERYIRREHRRMIVVEPSPAALLDQIEAYEPPRIEKWMDREEA